VRWWGQAAPQCPGSVRVRRCSGGVCTRVSGHGRAHSGAERPLLTWGAASWNPQGRGMQTICGQSATGSRSLQTDRSELVKPENAGDAAEAL
jgi:hypothetical protein